MSEPRQDVDEQAEVEARLARYDRWGADAIGARMHDIDRLRQVNLTTERDEDEYLALAAALAAKKTPTQRSATMGTVVSRWTGSGMVTFVTDAPTPAELPASTPELMYARAVKSFLTLKLEQVERAKMQKLGYTYDGRPLRGRR